MSRFNWFSLLRDGKVVGRAGALGQNGWRDDEFLMDYFQIDLGAMDEGAVLDEFEIVFDAHEGGIIVNPSSRGKGKAVFSTIPPEIPASGLILFRDVRMVRVV